MRTRLHGAERKLFMGMPSIVMGALVPSQELYAGYPLRPPVSRRVHGLRIATSPKKPVTGAVTIRYFAITE
jgi:hypothetical protein